MISKVEKQQNVSPLPSGSDLLQWLPPRAYAIYHERQSEYCCAKQRLCWEAQQGSSDAVPLLTQASVKSKDKWAAAPQGDWFFLV